jgi:hypothetical protein
VRGASIVQSGRGVGEILLGHEVVRLQCGFDIGAVDAERDTHDHVLGALDDLLVAAQQVRPLQSLEAEIIVAIVAIVDDRRVQAVLVLFMIKKYSVVFSHQQNNHEIQLTAITIS